MSLWWNEKVVYKPTPRFSKTTTYPVYHLVANLSADMIQSWLLAPSQIPPTVRETISPLRRTLAELVDGVDLQHGVSNQPTHFCWIRKLTNL